MPTPSHAAPIDRSRGRWIVVGALLAALGCGGDLPSARPSQSLPPLVDLDGQEIRPFADSSTKALVLLFVLPATYYAALILIF